MADDDRAAKAARAKALLKKRQAKGIGTGAANTLTPEASVAGTSRSASPAPVSQMSPKRETEKTEINDVFSENGDSSWLTSLPSVKSTVSPPPQAAPTEIVAGASSPANGFNELLARLKQQESVITSLEEKQRSSELTIKRLEERATQLQQTEDILRQERNNMQILSTRLQESEKATQEFEKLHKASEEREKSSALTAKEKSFNQQQAISLLVAEKTHLTESLDRMGDLETKLLWKDKELTDALSKSERLASSLYEAEKNLMEVKSSLLQAKEQELHLASKCREQERQLQLSEGAADELRSEAERHKRHATELELKIQSDDRAEKLLESLKKTQDRAEELEFQLIKLKKNHSTMKNERDAFDRQLKSSADAVSEWQDKLDTAEASNKSLARELADAIALHGTCLQAKDALSNLLDASDEKLKTAHGNLNAAASELQARGKQLQEAEHNARLATRRATDAERIQTELQAEGTTLMQSLNEMRPKIVELTSAKVDLGDRIEHLERTIRKRDAFIAELETSVEELEAQKVEMTSSEGEAAAIQAKELQSVRKQASDLQSAHIDLQMEYQAIASKIEVMQAESIAQKDVISRQLLELERTSNSCNALSIELSDARKAALDQSKFREDAGPFLERAQEEIEELRSQLNVAEEQLRYAGASLTPVGLGQSLDGEMMSALRQQHSLDQSNSSSKIRELDSALFDAQAETHALQLRIALLEEELSRSQSRSLSHASLPQHSSTRRISEKSRMHVPNPLSRSVFDIGLSPETRHKRKISLSMLKARIDSEMSSLPKKTSRPSLSRMQSTLSAVTEVGSSSRRRREPISDESHFHWCASCSGELIIL